MDDIKQFIQKLVESSETELGILIVAFVFDFAPYCLNYELTKLNNDLIRIAIPIFTISGIFISLNTLLIQHISNKRGSVMLELFFKDEVFLRFLATILYLSVILLLNALIHILNVYFILVIIVGILLCLFNLIRYMAKVYDLVNISKSIEYSLENLLEKEIDKIISKNSIDENDEKLLNDNLYKIYNIVKSQFKHGNLEIAREYIISLKKCYEKLYSKYSDNEYNGDIKNKLKNFFENYISILGLLTNGYINMLNKDKDMLKEPYWHEILRLSIESLCNIIEQKFKNNEEIFSELNIMKECIKNIVLIDGKNLSDIKFRLIYDVFENFGKFLKELEKPEDNNEETNIYFNIKWLYGEFFKNVIEYIILNHEKLNPNTEILLNKFMEKIYNESIIKNLYATFKKINTNLLNDIIYGMVDVLSSILYNLNKLNESKISNAFLNINDIIDEIYEKYIIILNEVYAHKNYTLLYHCINQINNSINNLNGKFKWTRYFKINDGNIDEKLKNILELFLTDKLKYHLLMASLGCSTAYNKLINYLLAGRCSIEDVKKAKEELEKDVSKYVKENEIDRVKRNINNIFEYLSKINKSSS